MSTRSALIRDVIGGQGSDDSIRELFNSGLELVKCFDPSAVEATDSASVRVGMRRLKEAMQQAVDSAAFTLRTLGAAYRSEPTKYAQSNLRTVADYINLGIVRPTKLLCIARRPISMGAALRICNSYISVQALAEFTNRLPSMQTFLDAMTFHSIEDGSSPDSSVIPLEAERDLLGLSLRLERIDNPRCSLALIEARFQKFRWSYVESYLMNHHRWQVGIESWTDQLDEIRRDVEGLKHLNSILRLGSPQGGGLLKRLKELILLVRRCEVQGGPSPQMAPICAGCGFKLGIAPLDADIKLLAEQVKRSVSIKLTELSRILVRNLLDGHGGTGANRLDELLEIVRASQSDLFAHVIDARLSSYIAQSLTSIH